MLKSLYKLRLALVGSKIDPINVQYFLLKTIAHTPAMIYGKDCTKAIGVLDGKSIIDTIGTTQAHVWASDQLDMLVSGKYFIIPDAAFGVLSYLQQDLDLCKRASSFIDMELEYLLHKTAEGDLRYRHSVFYASTLREKYVQRNASLQKRAVSLGAQDRVLKHLGFTLDKCNNPSKCACVQNNSRLCWHDPKWTHLNEL